MNLNNKRILVTGGTGLVGKPTIRQLIEAGAHVISLSRSAPPAHKNITHIPYDLKKPHKVTIQPYDAIVYIAANIPQRDEKKETECDAFENTLTPFVHFLDSFAQDCKRVIFTSTIDIYGRPDTPEFTEEESINPQTPYALAKSLSEDYLRYFATSHAAEATILRFSQVYGKNEPFVRVIPYILNALMNNQEFTAFGNLNNARKFLFAEDAAAAILAALVGPGGTFHIAGPESTSIADIIHSAENISNKQLKIQYSNANAAQDDLLPSIQLAQTVLGWKPKYTFYDGLKAVIENYE